MRERLADERNLTRRRFVTGAATAGAGLAGLVAASRLSRSGHSLQVLEARDRVGGRIWNHDLGDGHISERGATFIGPTQNHVAALAKELKIATFRDPKHPGTFQRNFNPRGGTQQDRFVGGSQRLPLELAKRLGDVVALRTSVRSIAQTRSAVTVVSDAHTVSAKRVVVAIPPTLAGRISFDPILPFGRDQLTQRYGQGTLTKVAAVYDEPFWRANGLTGSAVAVSSGERVAAEVAAAL